MVLDFLKVFLHNPLKELVLILIKFYQYFFSFDHSFWAKYSPIRVCIFKPSCSEYTYQSIKKFGLLKGLIMGFFRILRCNGFSKGGYDPVPEKFCVKLIGKKTKRSF